LTELFYKVFNKNAILLVVALAIPVLLVMFWNYANTRARTTVDAAKGELHNNKNQENITVDEYQLKEVNDSNQLRWMLNAVRGVMNPSTKDVDLETVHVDYFDSETGKMKMRLTSPIGKANEGTKQIALYSNEKVKVEAEGEDGKAKLLAAKVELIKNNQFLATGGVNIVWPGVAKVTGDRAEGSLASTDLKNFKIMGNTHASIGGM
jgi:LPS export ABC transporter protein LptC